MIPPDVVELIRKKRDGGRLAPEELGSLIASYAGGDVAEEQMSALLMAIYFRGLDQSELSA
ncbi:MAG: thymidine phosphorylase, partial [Acidimicrobiales bacterium]